MNAEILSVLEYWEREKGISREELIKILNDSLLASAKRAVGPARELRCTIDPKSGEIKAFARLVVVQKVVSKHDQISLFDARRVKPDAQLGEEVEIEVTPAGFGRIASQHARQILTQLLRRHEKRLVYEEFKDQVGGLITGVVRRFERSDVYVDLGKCEAVLPNRERVPNEDFQPNDRVLFYLKAVQDTPRGPEIILSRADPEFVIKLFKREVSEINDGTIEIKAIAREPGFRTKIAVYTRDPKVDPVGACVGLRGARVRNIVRELNNEKVDIIPWDPNIRNLITNALSPARIKSFEIDEARRRVKIWVSEDQLSLAIGRRGQNARLTSRLTGWEVDIEAEAVAPVGGFAEKVAQAIETLAAIPGINREMADALVHGGLTSLEDVLQAGEGYLASLERVGEHAAAIMQAAREEAARRQIKLGETTAA
ncbi:MAG: transcription termination factor NusA [Verrucomicrobiae bacterium]|nr:transcription termination factor NusA [Verrucomicrobiae bacterium]